MQLGGTLPQSHVGAAIGTRNRLIKQEMYKNTCCILSPFILVNSLQELGEPNIVKSVQVLKGLQISRGQLIQFFLLGAVLQAVVANPTLSVWQPKPIGSEHGLYIHGRLETDPRWLDPHQLMTWRLMGSSYGG